MSAFGQHDAGELLAWYANGTLDPLERAAIDRHLESCAECRLELERWRELRSLLASANAPELAPHPAHLQRLLARIARGELDDTADVAPGPGPVRRLRGLARATPGPVRWLLAATLTGVAVLGALVAGDAAPTPAGRFRTLSSAVPAAPRQPAIRVVFRPDISEAELRRLLLEARAEIVGGPSPLGAYALSLGLTASGESPEAVLALLRADPRVLLAEPIVGGDGDRR